MLSTFGLLLAPGMLWGWLFYRLHRYQKPDLRRLAALFLGGMLCGLVALLLNHSVEKYSAFWPGATETINLGETEFPFYKSGFWMMVGFNEETAKMLVLLLVSYPSKKIREPFDGILHGAVVALGFATLENMFYMQQYGLQVVVVRAVVTVPAHAFMTVPLGYFVAVARLRWEQGADNASVVRLLLAGWLIASVFHGTYDLWLSYGATEWAYAQIATMGLWGVWLSITNWKHSVYLPESHRDHQKSPMLRFLLRRRTGT
jgi:RsiW-degrading membrane proteinase PrsW (M82 family)